MFLTLFILYSFTIFSAPNKFDATYNLQARSAPGIGAEVAADWGYNQLMWGKRNPGDKNYLFGLIRPSLGVSSSAVINNIKGEIEVYPISILGVLIGRQYLNSDFEFPFFDCNTVKCKGKFEQNYLETRMVLGAKGLLLMASQRYQTISGPESQVPLADWRNVLLANPNGDHLVENKLILGYQFNKKMIALMSEYTRYQKSRDLKQGLTLVYQWPGKKYNYLTGIGSFQTTRVARTTMLYFRLQYNQLPWWKLF